MSRPRKSLYLTTTTKALLCVVLALISPACKQSDCAEYDSVPCHPEAETVKTVSNQTGIVAFDSVLNQWLITAAINGTYDSQDIGIVCNDLPEAYQRIGERVVFSGAYQSYSGDIRPSVGGQVYYYLFIGAIDNP